MEDRPTAAELLRAVGDLLADEVLPVVDVTIAHKVRVAANLCRIVERELMIGGDAAERERQDLAAVLGHEASLAVLNDELATRLRSADDEFLAATIDMLIDATVGKLAIDKPGYALEPERDSQQKQSGR